MFTQQSLRGQVNTLAYYFYMAPGTLHTVCTLILFFLQWYYFD